MSSVDDGSPTGSTVKPDLGERKVKNGVTGAAPGPGTKFWGEAARLAWKESAGFATLLGVLLYGVGRLLADGFYGQLNTTADLASVSTFSILEPAVIAAAMLAIIATIIMLLSDVISISADWLRKALGGVGLVVFAGGTVLWIAYGVIVGLVVLLILIPALINWLRRIGPDSPAFRVTLVGATLALFVGICVSAHAVGVHEANNVKRGKAVDLKFLGLDISSINAIPVLLTSIDNNAIIEQLAANHCLLQIGSGPNDILLFDWKADQTLEIPSSDVEVVTPQTSCANLASSARGENCCRRPTVFFRGLLARAIRTNNASSYGQPVF